MKKIFISFLLIGMILFAIQINRHYPNSPPPGYRIAYNQKGNFAVEHIETGIIIYPPFFLTFHRTAIIYAWIFYEYLEKAKDNPKNWGGYID